MKTLICLFLLVSGTQVPAISAEVVQVPTRIGEIEQTFKMQFIKGVEKGDTKVWLFVIQVMEPFQAVFPVAVPEGATDPEIRIAINAAATCAAFYEDKSKKRRHSKSQ